MLSVNLGAINDIELPGGKSVLVPLTGTDSLGGPISYTFSASDANVQLSLVSTASKSLVLNVSGTDSSNNSYTGTLVLHLFEDLAPETTTRIEQLVSQGYYNDLIFHRVVDGFMAQAGQTNNGNDTGVLLDDEFNTSLTFTSPGLLAMANRGADTSDAEFFVTAIDSEGTTNPIGLADMPQTLNFRYTIFGQLVSGFDTFEKIMSTPVTLNSQSGETSQPTNSITITSASLIDDTQNAVLRVFAPASFDGNSTTITVTATNANNETSQQNFDVAAVNDTNDAPPFLGPVGDQTTAVGLPATFTLTSTDQANAGVRYDAAIQSSPANGTLTIDHNTGVITVTPNAGFAGDIQVIVGVQDAAQTQNFDTQVITVHVVMPTLAPIANQSVAKGVPASFTLSATDPMGDGLVYSVVDASTLAAPINASVSIDQSTGNVTITPAAGFSGTLNLLARARSVDSPDVSSNYATTSFALSVVAPVLNTVSNMSTLDGVPVSFTLTASDALAHGLHFTLTGDTTNIDITIDHNTGAVTITPHAGFHGAVTLTAGVRDIDSPDDPANYVTQDFAFSVVSLNDVDDQTTTLGTPVQLTLTSSPAANGLHYAIFLGNSFDAPSDVTVNIDQTTGHVTITPVAGFVGTVSLRAAIRSANAAEDPSNYDWTDFELVVNGGPVVNDVADQTTSRGTPISVTLTSSNAPVEGGFYTLVDSSTNAPPANLTFTIDQQTGVATITPAPGFHGNISLRAAVRGALSTEDPANYDLSDPFNLSVDDVPTMNDVPDQITTLGTPVSFTATASDATAAGTFFKVFGANGSDAPEHVTFTIEQQSGLVTLTPAPGFVGAETLQIGVRSAKAIDNPANYDLQSFVLTVNVAPALNQIANQTTAVNAPVSFDLSASNVPTAGVAYSVVDPNTLSVPSNVTVNVDADGHVTLTPMAGYSGTVSLLARVRGADASDDPLNYSTQTFALTITAPTLTAISGQNTALGVPVSFTLSSSNASGNEVRYAIFGSSNDVNVSVDATTGAVTLTPRDGFQGSVTLTAGVRDINSPDVQATYTTQQFTFNVVSPTLSSVGNLTTTVGSASTMTLSSTVPTGFSAAYSVVDPTTLSTPSNVAVSIDQSTGVVTLTPNFGFTGTIQLLARVRAVGSNDVASNYVTQQFTLTVGGELSGDESSDGDVSVKISHGNLVIHGDKFDNAVTISVVSGQLIVSGTGTLINGSTSSFTTDAVSFTGKLKIEMGKGNDSVTIQELTVDGKASIKLGKGNDTLSIDSSSVGNNANLRGGKGDDSVTITDSTFSTKLKTHLGKGDDTLSLRSATVAGKAKVSGLSGSDDVTITDSTFSELGVTLGKGDDLLTVSGTTVNNEAYFNGRHGRNTYTDGGDNSLADLTIRHFNQTTSTAPSNDVTLNPISDISEGGTATLTGTYTDSETSSSHTLTVDWDDPNSTVDSTFAIPDAASLTTGQAINSSTDNVVLTVTSVDAGQIGYSAQHRYLDDGAAATSLTSSDTSTIRVTVNDGNTFNASETMAVTVDDLGPSVALDPAAGVSENGVVTLTGRYTDGGLLDAQTLAINWGDPNNSATSHFAIAAIQNTGGTSTLNVGQTFNSSTDSAVLTIMSIDNISGQVGFSVQHQYLDDGTAIGNGTAGDTGTISMSVTDDDAKSGAATTSVDVNNVAPTISLNAVSNIAVNGTATLTGMYTDIGLLDQHPLLVEWGDDDSSEFLIDAIHDSTGATNIIVGDTYNSSSDSAVLTITSVDASAGQVGFSVGHQYTTAGTAIAITATLLDDDTGSGSGSTTVNVGVIAPAISLNSIPSINETETVTLTGSFTNIVVTDAHALTVSWADPNNSNDSTFVIPATNGLSVNQTINSSTDGAVLTTTSVDTTTGQVGFSVKHQYIDDGDSSTGNSTISDGSTILVFVTGAVTGSGFNTTAVTVNNVAPTVVMGPVSDSNENDTVTLSGTYTDTGLADAHLITVDWDDPNSSNNATFTISRTSSLSTNATFNSTTDGAVLTITSVNTSTGAVGFSVQHQYTASNSLTVTTTVADDDLGSGSDTVSFVVGSV